MVFQYNFWSLKHRRVELVILEMYEGNRQSNSTAFSSFHPPPPPIVMRQAYIFPGHISAMATTVTEKGITNKELLCELSMLTVILLRLDLCKHSVAHQCLMRIQWLSAVHVYRSCAGDGRCPWSTKDAYWSSAARSDVTRSQVLRPATIVAFWYVTNNFDNCRLSFYNFFTVVLSSKFATRFVLYSVSQKTRPLRLI